VEAAEVAAIEAPIEEDEAVIPKPVVRSPRRRTSSTWPSIWTKRYP